MIGAGKRMVSRIYYIIIFLIMIFVGTGQCPVPTYAEEKKEAQQEVKDFSFAQYQNGGEKKWNLKGVSAEVMDNRVNIEQLSALSYGQGTMLKLKARQGSFNKGENLVHLRDNVIAAVSDGTRLTTDYLEWNTDSKNLFTDSFVNIKRPDMEINGKGAVCDLDAKTAELKQNIDATMKSLEEGILRTTNDERRTTILCDGPLELNYKKSRAVFHKNVKVEDARGTILADRIDVYFSPATRRIKCVVARGNVKIINGENITYSDKAIYLVEQGRVILPNRPKLIIKNE